MLTSDKKHRKEKVYSYVNDVLVTEEKIGKGFWYLQHD